MHYCKALANYFAPFASFKFMIEFFMLYPELAKGFVLAPNKDLAVSPPHYCGIFPEGNANLFKLARHCSHLCVATEGYYPLYF